MLEEKDLRESMKVGLSRPTRLRSCKAIVYHTIDNEFIVLQSYNTIVAFIDLETHEAFDILRLCSRNSTYIPNLWGWKGKLLFTINIGRKDQNV